MNALMCLTTEPKNFTMENTVEKEEDLCYQEPLLKLYAPPRFSAGGADASRDRFRQPACDCQLSLAGTPTAYWIGNFGGPCFIRIEGGILGRL